MNTLLYQAKENDIYYCKENKKLYIRRFNEWEIINPLNSKVYVLVGLDEYNRTNIIHLWDGNDMVVMSERLFLGETTGTAYDGGKGKALADIVSRIVIDGDGTKYLSDDGTYKLIVADTAETVKTTDEILVAGGPLADLLNKAGINSISSDTSMQDLFISLFTKELWPTNLVFKEGTVSATIAAPSFTLSSTNLVEVGATVTIGKTTLSAATMSTTARTYSGFTYGYSSTNDNTKDSSNTTITVNASNAALNSVNYTMKRTTNGSVENATANTNPA
ncbi:MAG: hypothetical protein [Bacteriophage sp.]|nr:MAG: hypothetical protein [Bacteriophage sp.]